MERVAAEATQVVGDVGEASARLAHGVIAGLFIYFGEVAVLLVQALRGFRNINAIDLARQMALIGVDTVPIALMTVGFSGAVLALYSVNTLSEFGVPDYVGGLVALSIFRETGPILVGVVVAARAGSAMTAEIGSMKVSEQIDALRTMAINPIDYLVSPRVLAGLLMLPVVTLFADFAGTFGGLIVGLLKGVSQSGYLDSIHQWLALKDIFGGLLKSVVFGMIVALIGCREGMSTTGGASGVGQSTTRSVVISIVLIFVANFLLSFLMYNTKFI